MEVETIDLLPLLHSYRAVHPCGEPLPHDRKVGLDLGVVSLVGRFSGQSTDKVTTIYDASTNVGSTNFIEHFLLDVQHGAEGVEIKRFARRAVLGNSSNSSGLTRALLIAGIGSAASDTTGTTYDGDRQLR